VSAIPSPNGRWFATEKDHGLWLRSAADGQMHPLVADGEERYAWRVEWVEWTFDRAKWSPNSAKLAAFKIDTRQVDSFPEVDWLDVTEEVEWWPVARAGRPIPSTELHIVDVESKAAVRVPTGEGDHYIQTIGWTRDGSELLFLRMGRDYKKMDLMAADANTGKARVVVSETQKTFVDGAQWRLIQPTFLPDGKRFLWLSERDGWKHLYLYSLDGTLIRRLTQGQWPVIEVEAVDAASEWVYFTARAEPRIYDTHGYRVRLDGTGFKRLTEATGQHNLALSPSRQYFLDTHSTPARPETTELRAADGRLILTVATTNTKAFADLKWSPPEEFVVKAADGVTDLHGLLYKPYDFNKSRRYPVVDYIFGNPNFEWVVKTFSTNRQHEAAALAQAGFLVLLVDGRGTPGRGKAFQDAIYKQFGTVPIADHVATLKQLAKSRPYMDLRRVGLLGSQWPGSYMAIRGLVTAPDVYCAGVGRLVTLPDPSSMMAVLIEPYMGLPQDDPEAYEAASSLPHIGKLKGHLAIIAETDEVQARFADVMKLLMALNRADKRYDLVLNPERPEGLVYRTYYMSLYRHYLEKYLQAMPRALRVRPPVLDRLTMLVRRALDSILVLVLLATGAELLLLGHTEDALQWAPLVLIGLATRKDHGLWLRSAADAGIWHALPTRVALGSARSRPRHRRGTLGLVWCALCVGTSVRAQDGRAIRPT